jgi:hypothetical protein
VRPQHLSRVTEKNTQKISQDSTPPGREPPPNTEQECQPLNRNARFILNVMIWIICKKCVKRNIDITANRIAHSSASVDTPKLCYIVNIRFNLFSFSRLASSTIGPFSIVKSLVGKFLLISAH